MKKLNVNQLKYIAAFFMVLDTLALALPAYFPTWLRLITRFVAPLFAFFMTEGFFYTRNRKKYMARLWVAAILMQLGGYISFLILGERFQIIDNIFLTLAIGFTVMHLLESAKASSAAGKKIGLYAAGIAVFLAGLVFSVVPITIGRYMLGIEGGIQVLFVVLIFYLFHENRMKASVVFLVWNAAFVAVYNLLGGIPRPGDFESLSIWFNEFCYNSDVFPCLFLPFLLLYNGEKGKNSAFNRNFFYVFYPLHLWIVHIIAALTAKP